MLLFAQLPLVLLSKSKPCEIAHSITTTTIDEQLFRGNCIPILYVLLFCFVVCCGRYCVIVEGTYLPWSPGCRQALVVIGRVVCSLLGDGGITLFFLKSQQRAERRGSCHGSQGGFTVEAVHIDDKAGKQATVTGCGTNWNQTGSLYPFSIVGLKRGWRIIPLSCYKARSRLAHCTHVPMSSKKKAGELCLFYYTEK